MSFERVMIGAPTLLVAILFGASLMRVDSPVVMLEGRVLRPSDRATRVSAWVRTAVHEQGRANIAPRQVRFEIDGVRVAEATTDDDGFALVDWPKGLSNQSRLDVVDAETTAKLVSVTLDTAPRPPLPFGVSAQEFPPSKPGGTKLAIGLATGRLVTNVPARMTVWATPPLDPAGSISVEDASGLRILEKRICKDGRAELIASADFHVASMRLIAKNAAGEDLSVAFMSPGVARGAVEVFVPISIPASTEKKWKARISSARSHVFAILRDGGGVLSTMRIDRGAAEVTIPPLQPGLHTLTTTPELGPKESESAITYPFFVGSADTACETPLPRITEAEAAAQAPSALIVLSGSDEGQNGPNRKGQRRAFVWGAYAITVLIELIGFGGLLRRKPSHSEDEAELESVKRTGSRIPAIASVLFAFTLIAAFIAWRF